MRRPGIFLFLVAMLLPFHSFSWGFFSHKLINKMAVFTMPSDVIIFFKENVTYLEEHAVDADKRKFTNKDEAHRHYIDLEYYHKWHEEKGLEEIPMTYLIADSIYSKDSIKAWGSLPWTIKLNYYNLIEAFKEKNKESILRYLSDIGHYIADCHVPLHTTVNYNGQLTNQKGIHGLWETNIPVLSWEKYDLLTGKALYIEDIDVFIKKIIDESHSQKDSVLIFEEELTKAYNEGGKFAIKNKYNGVKKTYSDDFVKDYEEILNGMVERKMKQSIRSVGSIWFTAWVNAGQPDLRTLK